MQLYGLAYYLFASMSYNGYCYKHKRTIYERYCRIECNLFQMKGFSERELQEEELRKDLCVQLQK
jgi:hypothetical protein